MAILIALRFTGRKDSTTTTKRDWPVHIETPLTPDTPEIPFDPAMNSPGVFGYQIEFGAEEKRRIGAQLPLAGETHSVLGSSERCVEAANKSQSHTHADD